MDLQSKFRALQDDVSDARWRITLISPAPDGKPATTRLENWAGLLAVISILGFPIGAGLAFYRKGHSESPLMGCVIAVSSWAICLAALALKNDLKKKRWIYVAATCIDTEIASSKCNLDATWNIRILCNIVRDGVTTPCTPTVHGRSFESEAAAQNFLKFKISPNGACTLRVNPQNMREANLSEPRFK
jgi:hypothetical protein